MLWSAGSFVVHRPRHLTRHRSCATTWAVNPPLDKPRTGFDRKPEVDLTFLRPMPRHSPPPFIKMELLNTQFLTNNSCLIHDHILAQEIDLCLTETWQRPEVYSVLNETCPTGYSYIERAHSTGRGGGPAVYYLTGIHLTAVPLPTFSSFECLGLRCNYPLHITILFIYRPPKPHPQLQHLLML